MRINTAPANPSTLVLPSIDYAAVRLQWCQAALVALLRKWAVYIVMGLAILGAFSVGAMTSIPAMTAWSVLPLFKAAQWPWTLALSCSCAHALIGACVAAALRPVLWPAAWQDAESALPVSRHVRLRSDAAVVALGLAPLFAVHIAGALTWQWQAPAWLAGLYAKAWALLALSAALSIGMGVKLVGRQRATHGRAAPLKHADVNQQALAGFPVIHWSDALFKQPLLQGPARQTLHWMASHATVLCMLLAGMAGAQSPWAPWWLASVGLVSLWGTARLGQLIEAQLGEIHQACDTLPLNAVLLRRARQALQMVPAVVSWLFMPGAWAASQMTVRPALAGAYLVTSVAAHWSLVALASPDNHAQISRWMVVLVILTALASEVFA